ncbi:D-sedoheptulose 7-phosphate isomerase [Brevinema andersonii]|uniref:D-sedoheptulose 7-phosphate isomerase n=1 Tax=Brevinema andersonii TaxID=34097 RepID=A0A1I1D1D5_BREAD|nr:SIS domain-containing protein [Brevinema andersonii]SFB68745.1 D-sedoheptulose 7-phosphate isomerase [Brevinema andersonii]
MHKIINNYFDRLKLTLDMMNDEEIIVFAELLENARKTKNTVFVMCNGGSAVTANHFVCDFNKGTGFGKPECFRVICLNDSMSTLSVYSNDVAYNEVFVEQLKNFLKPRNLVVGIYCSGNSENILKAVQFANQNDAVTIV